LLELIKKWKTTTANSGFARLRNMWLIHVYLSQEILS
jgi:hypothetical protein